MCVFVYTVIGNVIATRHGAGAAGGRIHVYLIRVERNSYIYIYIYIYIYVATALYICVSDTCGNSYMYIYIYICVWGDASGDSCLCWMFQIATVLEGSLTNIDKYEPTFIKYYPNIVNC